MSLAVLRPLTELDAWLDGELGLRASLHPSRARAPQLVELGERMLQQGADAPMQSVLVQALARVARGQAEHFPQNLFWDLDHTVAHLASLSARGAGAVSDCADTLVALHAMYGASSPIRFRYVHDFAYGFDWERWVRADPQGRSGIGPLDAPFLARTLQRGRELLTAIERGDGDYPPLAPDRFRNPFGFDRDPGAEAALLRQLQAADLLPVRAFCFAARPRCDRPFSQLRKAHAAGELAMP